MKRKWLWICHTLQKPVTSIPNKINKRLEVNMSQFFYKKYFSNNQFRPSMAIVRPNENISRATNAHVEATVGKEDCGKKD